MRKLLITIFAVLLVYINVGYYVQICIQKELAKEEMNERILIKVPDSCLTRFELKTIEHEIVWQEEEKEFWFHNELYDLVRKTVADGKTYLVCINDKKEEKIIDGYRYNVQKKTPSNQEQKNDLSFFALLFIQTKRFSLENQGSYCKKDFISLNENVLHQYKQTISPPPKA